MKLHRNTIATVLTILLAGCELVVDVDVPKLPKMLVISSPFSPDSAWTTTVSLTRDVLDDDEFEKVENATVTIFNHTTGAIVDQLMPTGSYPGVYIGDERPVEGVTYRIRVEAPGRTTVEALGVLPPTVPIISMEVDRSDVDSEGRVPVKITFADPPGFKNFYQLRCVTMSTYQSPAMTYDVYFDVDDPSLQSYIDTYGILVFNDDLFEGKTTTITCRVDEYAILDGEYEKFAVSLASLSSDFYQYATTLNLQEATQGDPFAQPVNVFTNVQNGLGIFAGYSPYIEQY